MIKERSKTIALFGGLFVVMVVLSYQLMQRREKGMERDVVQAEIAFQEWKCGKEDTFAGLQAVLKKRSTLRSKYGPYIAQELIDRKEGKLAEPYLVSSFDRLPDESPFHRNYAKTTLLINQKEYLAALFEARKLKEKLHKESSSNFKMLEAFNILRVALLEKEAGSARGEFETWKAFEALDAQTVSQLQASLEQEKLALQDYITHRKSVIVR